ncbi:MAG: adenosine kinase [Chlamydiales bacterium]
MKPVRRILGIGAPTLDYLITVEKEILANLVGELEGMEYINRETFDDLLIKSKGRPHQTVGGSTTNKLKVLSSLGHSCVLHGMIGRDEVSACVNNSLRNYPIQLELIKTEYPSTIVLCLVDPYGHRTFRTVAGASTRFRGKDVVQSVFNESKLVILEGYSLTNGCLLEKAISLSKETKARIVFDLACFEFCSTHQEYLLSSILPEVDIIIANEKEIKTLLDMKPKQGCAFLAGINKHVIVTMGSKGCWVSHGSSLEYCPANPQIAIDTTGAGDYFAGGFLHGLLSGKDIKTCGAWGARLASEIVLHVGTDLPSTTWKKIKNSIQS